MTATRYSFLVTDTGEVETLLSFREKHAQYLSSSQLAHRYKKLGRPKEVSIEHLCIAMKHGGQNAIIIEVAGKQTDIASVAEICNARNNCNHSHAFYLARWYAMGRPKKIKNLKWFLMSSEDYKAAMTKRRQRLAEARGSDLSRIPAGDLAHLSTTRNCGKGKGEIPDEEWLNMNDGRHDGAATCSLNLPKHLFRG